MGLFGKKKKEKEVSEDELMLPDIPELPELPELPSFENRNYRDESLEDSLPKLPSIPNNSYGKQFSRNSIKEAVSRERESDSEVFPEFKNVDIDMDVMERPLKKILTREMQEESPYHVPSQFRDVAERVRRVEPIFVRIDKFQESLKIFEDTRRKVEEIEKMLREIREVKRQEEEELSLWEREIQVIKGQLDKIDRDIFSVIQ